VSMNFFFLKLIIWNIDIHTCLLDSTFLCPHLFKLKKNLFLLNLSNLQISKYYLIFTSLQFYIFFWHL
jgi:hypothetical protein